jgi:hypothetical protein
MIQAFSLIFNFFNIASPCGDMAHNIQKSNTRGTRVYGNQSLERKKSWY